ncbi:MAG: PfkB family carbohydrate kinase [Anaerolineales bacterium]
MTSAADSLDLALLRQLTVLRKSASVSTSFENQYPPGGRVQTLRTRAVDLELADVPESWRSAEIVHLAPIAGEVHPDLARAFPQSFVGVTPQGSMRTWDSTGRVSLRSWETIRDLIEEADAVVLSIEDLQLDRSAAASMATHCKILVVTEGAQGATLYERDRTRPVPTTPAREVDPTGAGDVFAAVFFIRLHESGDPWESAVLANQIAAKSVSRPGLAGAPTPTEARAVLKAIGNR